MRLRGIIAHQQRHETGGGEGRARAHCDHGRSGVALGINDAAGQGIVGNQGDVSAAEWVAQVDACVEQNAAPGLQRQVAFRTAAER